MTTPSFMTLTAHLNELRRRMLWVLFVFLSTSLAAYSLHDHVLYYLALPLLSSRNSTQDLIYTGLTEAFSSYVKLSCFCGALVSIPFFFIQTWLFISPGCYGKEKKMLRPLFLGSPTLFILGLAFSYILVLPAAYSFFLTFQDIPSATPLQLTLHARISEYVSLSMSLLLAFGFCFQLPILLILLEKMNILSCASLRKGRRYSFLLVLMISAILTPPDLLSMIALACPLYGLYEATIIYMALAEKRLEKRKDHVGYQMDS